MSEATVHNGTNPYTCISCHVAFKDAEMQRGHYKSDWHRYNLKRKVADLPPVTAEDFFQKVMTQKSIEQEAKQDKSVFCQACKKSFGNQNAFDNHLNSKKHKENIKNFDISATTVVKNVDAEEAAQGDETMEEVDSDEWEEDTENPIDNNNCLFCLHHSRNFLVNLEHMTIAHSFFIPDIEFCTDVHGLLRYLGEKISEGFMCLWCNEKGKTFHSADSARSHMLDKGHCKMLHEGLALAEYADFYDYSASYPDATSENIDEEIAMPELEGNEYQLVLPSGVTVGHRSLMKYYKQSVNTNAVVVHKNTRKLHKVLAHYRALGWTDTQQEAAARKARDLHYMKRMHSKLSMKLGVKANKFQPHYRIQVMF